VDKKEKSGKGKRRADKSDQPVGTMFASGDRAVSRQKNEDADCKKGHAEDRRFPAVDCGGTLIPVIQQNGMALRIGRKLCVRKSCFRERGRCGHRSTLEAQNDDGNGTSAKE
jgi:hypothetical protein